MAQECNRVKHYTEEDYNVFRLTELYKLKLSMDDLIDFGSSCEDFNCDETYNEDLLD